ncbi:AIR synthase-related protein [Enterococcus mundtii]
MGIGMVIAVAPEHASEIIDQIRESGEEVYQIGKVVPFEEQKVVIAEGKK